MLLALRSPRSASHGSCCARSAGPAAAPPHASRVRSARLLRLGRTQAPGPRPERGAPGNIQLLLGSARNTRAHHPRRIDQPAASRTYQAVASDAPVSSVTPARNKKTTRMSTPTLCTSRCVSLVERLARDAAVRLQEAPRTRRCLPSPALGSGADAKRAGGQRKRRSRPTNRSRRCAAGATPATPDATAAHRRRRPARSAPDPVLCRPPSRAQPLAHDLRDHRPPSPQHKAHKHPERRSAPARSRRAGADSIPAGAACHEATKSRGPAIHPAPRRRRARERRAWPSLELRVYARGRACGRSPSRATSTHPREPAPPLPLLYSTSLHKDPADERLLPCTPRPGRRGRRRHRPGAPALAADGGL